VQWYLCGGLLKRLAQDLEDMAPELWPFIQKAHAAVRPRHLARHGEVPAAAQPHSRDRLRRGAKRAGCDQRRAGAREASDAVEARRFNGFDQGQRGMGIILCFG
jgi:hypothetical protein